MKQQKRTSNHSKRVKFNLNRLAYAVMLATAASGSSSLVYANGQGLGLPGLKVDGTTMTTYYANTELPRVTTGGVTGGFKKFLDPIALLDADMAAGAVSALKQGLPIAIPNAAFPDGTVGPNGYTDLLTSVATPYNGADYYEIGIVDYREQLSSNLPVVTLDAQNAATGGTHLRGYVQLVPSTWVGTDLAGVKRSAVPLFHIDGTPVVDAKGSQLYGAAKPHYLGPVILAFKGTPVRVLYRNLLPKQGDPNSLLPIPVDKTYVGAGVGPDGVNLFQENRAELHLHGGVTPWISDGTPHQWTVPVGDTAAAYQTGSSFQNVPDMADPGQGSGTIYWTNEQSSRLMFYHDHTSGITRLNVYNGEAAGYVLLDKLGTGEHTLPIPGTGLHSLEQIPLVIQDKTFVPSDIDAQDPLWNKDNSGTTIPNSTSGRGVVGDLWFPHVYETNQDPASADGTNPVGRWDWAPYFWPVFPSQYALPTGAVGDETGTPEAFVDTPLVNGTVYPYLEVKPQAYRFRVLSAGNDRFLNLGFYVAEPLSIGLAAAGTGYTAIPTVSITGGAPAANLTTAAATALLGLQGISNSGNPNTYSIAPIVTISAPNLAGGTPAEALASLALPVAGGTTATSFAIDTITLTNVGNGYSVTPVVTITPAPGESSGASAWTVPAANIDIGLAGIKITNDGTSNGTSPWTSAPTVTISGGNGAGAVAVASVNTEVKMVPFDSSYVAPSKVTPNGHSSFPTTGSLMGTGWGFPDSRVGGVPDPATAGPDIVQIGSEGGLLPNPVVIPSTPINYEYNKRSVTVLNTLEHGLFLGPAERADIVVDFSQYAGKTLILYNDAPAPLPAGDPRIDYYTGNPDFTSSGGAPSTLPGYGPNTRTVMQFRVAASGQSFTALGGTTTTTPPYATVPGANGIPAFNVAALTTALPAAYAATQARPVVAESAYNKAFPDISASQDQYLGIYAGSLQQPTFSFTSGSGAAAASLTSIQLISGGTGYQVAPQVTIVDSAANPGTGATASATLKLDAISVTSGGSGYIAAPTVTIATANGGAGAGATAAAYLKVGTVQISNGGSGYATAPTVTFSKPGPGGVQATGTATVSGGVVTSITVTNPGSGYNIAPTCTLPLATKPNVSATCAVSAAVSNIVLTAPNPQTGISGGLGYTDLSKVTVTVTAPPAGTTAGVPNTTATATASSGAVDAVTLVSPGSGYNVASTSVKIAAPAVGTVATAAASSLGGMPIRNVAIQELFEPTFGRMNATLGVELPLTTAITQTTLPLAYVDPTTEKIASGQTQIWKITHNGVDSHPVHFHLVNVQVINRVGWDGTVKPPHDNELGWKETVRMNPLEDVYVAVKAVEPPLPGFGLPQSWRPQDPSQPLGSTLGFSQFDPATGNPATVVNNYENYDWEYVWHCHILGHEENDFMRPFVLNANTHVPLATEAPTLNSITNVGGNSTLSFTDNSLNEYRFDIQRASVTGGKVGAYSVVGSALANAKDYTDTAPAVAGTDSYAYKVCAVSSAAFTSSLLAPVEQSNCSAAVEVVPTTAAPLAPTNLVFNNVTTTSLTALWVDNAINETGFLLERSANNGATWTIVTPLGNTPQSSVAANVTTDADAGLTPNTTYQYRLSAVNAVGASSPYATGTVTTQGVPNFGTAIATANSPTQVTVNWALAAGAPNLIATGFNIVRTGGGAAASFTAAASATSFVDTTALQNTAYVYNVTAINASSPAVTLSGTAATASVQTPYAAAAALSGFVATGAANPVPSVTLGWVATPAANVSGYTLSRCLQTVANANCTLPSSVWSPAWALPAGANSYVDNTVVLNTAYTYKLQAANGPANVSNIVQVSVKTPATGVVVIAPATPSVTMRTNPTARISVNWTVPTVAGQVTPTSFLIFRSIDGVNFSQVGTVSGNVRNFSDAAVVTGTTYSYYVVGASIAAGVTTLSAASPTVVAQFVVPAVPAAPVAAAVSATSVSLNWPAVAGATSYQLYRNGVATGAPVTTTTATANTPASNTTYSFAVAAINSLGTSAPSAGTSVLSLPAAPRTTATRGARGSLAANLTWTAPTGTGTITAATVLVRVGNGANWVSAASLGLTVTINGATAANAAGTGATIRGLTTGVTYAFAITVSNTSGASTQGAASGNIVAR